MRTDCVICLLTAVVCWISCSSGKIQPRKKTKRERNEEKVKHFLETRHRFHVFSSALFCLPASIRCTHTKFSVIATMNKCSDVFILDLDCYVECIHWICCFSKCVTHSVMIERLNSPTFLISNSQPFTACAVLCHQIVNWFIKMI